MLKTKRTKTRRTHFTERRLEALATPEKARAIVYDARVPALGVKIEPTGTKTFFWFRAVPEEEQPDASGKPTWKTIGAWPDVSLDSARAKAEEYNVKLANWKKDGCHAPSPFATTKNELTLDELVDYYVTRHLRAHAQRPDAAEKDVRWQVEKYLVAWKTRNVSTIRRKDVLDLHAIVGKKHGHNTANRLIQLLRAAFNVAIDNELWHGENPVTRIKLFPEKERTRFLQPDEVPRFFAALKQDDSADFRDFVVLALWTSARKGDVLSMRWSDVSLDDNVWTVPFPKGGESYVVPLTPEAVEVLRDRQQRRSDASAWVFVFPSFGKAGHIMNLKGRWAKFVKRAKLDDFRQHDLRRTRPSWEAAYGTSPLVIGKGLGHRSEQATRVYSRLNLDPVRASINAATQAIIAAGKKVLPETASH